MVARPSCGGCPNAQYTDILSCMAGMLNPEKATYRSKQGISRANNFRFVCEKGITSGWSLSFGSVFGFMWVNKLFFHRACEFCDDTFAEVADAIFMDAWLSEYMNDPAGTSLLIVREPLLEKLLNKAILDKELQLNKITIDMLIQSRQTVVNFKRKKMRQRLAFGLKRGQRLSLKRDKPASVLSVRELYLLSAMWRAMTWSKVAFLAQLESGPGLKTFHRIMLRHLWYDYLTKAIFRLVGRVNRSIRKFLKC